MQLLGGFSLQRMLHDIECFEWLMFCAMPLLRSSGWLVGLIRLPYVYVWGAHEEKVGNHSSRWLLGCC